MIDPADLLREAQTLFGVADGDEVRRRTAVSRAYYAAYHHAKRAAEAAGYQEDGNASVHWQLRRHYKSTKDPKLKRIAQFLWDLKGLRVRADYELAGNLSISDARDAIAMARHIVSALPKDGQ